MSAIAQSTLTYAKNLPDTLRGPPERGLRWGEGACGPMGWCGMVHLCCSSVVHSVVSLTPLSWIQPSYNCLLVLLHTDCTVPYHRLLKYTTNRAVSHAENLHRQAQTSIEHRTFVVDV